MKIAFCSAEVAPFSQVGGLGDVAGSLPRALADSAKALADSAEIIVISPRYGFMDPMSLERLAVAFEVEHAGRRYALGVSRGCLPGGEVPVYFLECEALFARWEAVYPPGRPDLEMLGFDVLARAIFPLLRELDFAPDILHLNDWHTALAAPMLRQWRQEDAFWHGTRSLLTLHNLLHQGIDRDCNRLAEGLRHADWLNTVSPTYAREIQTPEYGAGLEGLLQERSGELDGIVNGIDTEIYNPRIDPFLSANYTAETAAAGKRLCKSVVQMELGLPVNPAAALVGFVGRLTEQKGLDILVPAIRALCREGLPVQWAILGSGEADYEAALRELQQEFPNVRAYFGFHLALARQIYAGSDMFVMPSRFEPCGLGQLIALRYGSVPIARATGGLADTVHDVRTGGEAGNGFVFRDYAAVEVQQAVQAAWDLYGDRPDAWSALRTRGMREDHGWAESAREYLDLYRRLLR